MSHLKHPYTKDEIQQIDSVVGAFQLLEDNDISYEDIETLEEMKALLIRELSNDQSAEVCLGLCPGTGDTGQDVMEKILEKNQKMKEELSTIYGDLLSFLSSGELEPEVENELRINFADFIAKIKTYNGELMDDECPIIVAGETSAGKSSLLNLLLGANVLPTSLLSCTSAICRLRNSQKKRIVIFDDQNCEKHRISLEGIISEESLQEKIGHYIIKDDYKMVDLYWPIPLLKNNVIIVDTPGIGESEDLTDILLQYLPNAVAFIYVINSFHAGGVHSDRLVKIIREQKKWKTEGKLQSFDSSSAIFVCNKWDLVPPGEEQKVWEDTLERLVCWPGFKKENAKKQVFKFSCTEMARYQAHRLGQTEMFKKLLTGIEELIPASLENKVKRHYEWLRNFLHKLQLSLAARVNNAKKSEEEKKQKQTEVTARLTKLRQESQKISEKIKKKADEGCSQISAMLLEHLKQPHICDELLQSWKLEDYPTGSDIEVIKFLARNKILELLQQKIELWIRDGRHIDNLSCTLEDDFRAELQLLKEECDDIDMLIEGKSMDGFDLTYQGYEEIHTERLFSTEEKVILGVTAPVWIPLVLVAGILALPIAVGIGIREVVKEYKMIEKYNASKADYLHKWIKEVLDELRPDNIDQLITECYLQTFIERIDFICDEVIPRRIEADETLINNIVNDIRSSSEVLLKYSPLQSKSKKILGNLLLFYLQYFQSPNVVMNHLDSNRSKIGQGSYSDVYVVGVSDCRNITKAAIKVLRHVFTRDDVAKHMTEIECLRKLSHENVVSLYGVLYNPDSQEKLQIVTEYCDMSLEKYIFLDPLHICGRYSDGQKERSTAFGIYIKMSTQICAGLIFIHGQCFIHRDLKLSNVLVKIQDNIVMAKLCDMGFSKEEEMMTGTYCGTVSHMAPEVLQRKLYFRSADIYSLAIMLWEMWYGKAVYGELVGLDNHRAGSYIIGGYRPEFKDKYAPYDELQVLIQKCWEQKFEDRPSASDVKSELHDIIRHKTLSDKHKKPLDL